MKPKHNHGPNKQFHVSFVLKKSKVVSIGVNSYSKRNLICLSYKPTKVSLSNKAYIPSIHSEMDATAKVKFTDFDNYTLVNIRINNNGEVANSCPCANCAFQLGKMNNFTKIFYSTDDGTFARFP